MSALLAVVICLSSLLMVNVSADPLPAWATPDEAYQSRANVLEVIPEDGYLGASSGIVYLSTSEINAYKQMGKYYYKTGDYENSMKCYRKARDYEGHSEVFSDYRQQIYAKYFLWFVAGVILLLALIILACKKINRYAKKISLEGIRHGNH